MPVAEEPDSPKPQEKMMRTTIIIKKEIKEHYQ